MISLITPIHNTTPQLLSAFINSVKAQTYKNWELCIANDASTNPETINFLQHLKNNTQQYKISVIDLPHNMGIGEATQKAYEISKGKYIAFADSDDELHPDAFRLSVEALEINKVDLVYSDEAVTNLQGDITTPHFKPDFSYDLLLSQNYICHFVAVQRHIYERAGGLRGGFDGSQDHDFLLRVTEVTQNIAHIPEVLYYWRNVPNSITHDANSQNNVWERGRRAIAEHLQRKGIESTVHFGKVFGTYTVRYKLNSNPLVSIIIPFKDNFLNLERCVKTIHNNSTYKNHEIIIINSKEENNHKLSRLKKFVHIINFKEPFNYSRLLNVGINKANGEYIVTLHDDVTPLKEDWIEALLEHAQRPEIGCVGGKLLYPNKTIQHAGVLMGIGSICIHAFVDLPDSQIGYYGRATHIQNMSAVTGACMMFKKSIFNCINGFDDTNLIIDYTDIDFCLRVREEGYLNLYTPICICEHLMNKTRGATLPPRLRNKLTIKDTQHMRARHSNIISKGDPYYNKNFSHLNTFALPKVIKNVKLISTKQNTPPTAPQEPSIVIQDDYVRTVKKSPPPHKIENSQINQTMQKPPPINTDPITTTITPLVSFIIPVYNHYPVVVASLIPQEYKHFEAIVVHDGPSIDVIKKQIDNFNDQRIKLVNTDKRYNDWGHTPRSYGLQFVSNKSELLVFTGADNYYVPKFLLYMVNCFSNQRVNGAYCNCIHNYWDWGTINTRLSFGNIDCGCFMIKTSIAKEIGWKHKVHEADWKFIYEVMQKYGRGTLMKVSKTLFVHN